MVAVGWKIYFQIWGNLPGSRKFEMSVRRCGAESLVAGVCERMEDAVGRALRYSDNGRHRGSGSMGKCGVTQVRIVRVLARWMGAGMAHF